MNTTVIIQDMEQIVKCYKFRFPDHPLNMSKLTLSFPRKFVVKTDAPEETEINFEEFEEKFLNKEI